MYGTNIFSKRRNWLFSLLTAGFLLGSCDDSLYLDPISEIEEGNFYKNANDINLALMGTYNRLQNMMVDEWVLTEVRSDNTQITPNASVSRDITIRNLDAFKSNSLNGYVEDYWRSTYNMIALTNDVLDHIEVVTNENLRKQYEGEARFLRAHGFFNLVRLWGGVFLVDHSITGEEAIAKNYKRSTEKEVYDFVIRDLEYAAENLPATYPGNQTGRLTKWAAKALLAKALLTVKGNENVKKAEALLREVTTQSGHSLLPSYPSVFSPTNEFNSEILFAVRYKSGNVGLGSPFANFFAPDNSADYVVTGDGSEYNVPTQDVTNAFNRNGEEIRKNVSMSETWKGKNGVVNNFRYVTKYLSNVEVAFNAENDWPVIRYADVLLLLAEAINEVNKAPTQEAIDLVNQVHSRANAGNRPFSLTTEGTYYNFVLALAKERRMEFAFENQRWFDLLRLGLAIPVMNSHFATDPHYNDPARPEFKVKPLSNWQLVLPIPQFEIDVNPNVTQNIGY